jgi:hydrogenase 3 maturation protease
MGLPPGSIRIVPKDRVADAGIGTHQLPLDSLCDVVSPYAESIIIIGIQPGVVEIGEPMTDEVIEAGERLLHMIDDGSFRDLEIFLPD